MSTGCTTVMRGSMRAINFVAQVRAVGEVFDEGARRARVRDRLGRTVGGGGARGNSRAAGLGWKGGVVWARFAWLGRDGEGWAWLAREFRVVGGFGWIDVDSWNLAGREGGEEWAVVRRWGGGLRGGIFPCGRRRGG